MRFVIYDVDFSHRPGEFSQRTVAEFYFLSCFRTDYMIEVDGKIQRGRVGDLFIARPGDVIYHGSVDGGEGFRNDWIHIDGADFGELLARYPLPTGVPFRVSGTEHLASAIKTIHRESSYALPGWEEKCEMAIKGAIIDIFREYTRRKEAGGAEKIERAYRRMIRDFKHPWTLSELAGIAGYSESRFAALYKKYRGTAPIAELVCARIERAERMMLYGDLSLGEIAEAVGFSSIYYFSRCFKAKVGSSPSEYRREKKRA